MGCWLASPAGLETKADCLAHLAKTDIPLLLIGGSRADRAALAFLIHRHSRRRGQPFLRPPPNTRRRAFPRGLVGGGSSGTLFRNDVDGA